MQTQSDSTSREISINAVEEINRLHGEILNHARKSLEHAIRVGELLNLSKTVLKHGEWLDWIENNMPFNARTAQRYMSCYDRREQFINDNVTHLSEAYALILSNNGKTSAEPQKLHAPNFHSQAVRLRQNLVALFNHHLQRRPLRQWHTEEIYDLFCSLKPMTEICSQLELELNTRGDAPSSYRQSVAG